MGLPAQRTGTAERSSHGSIWRWASGNKWGKQEGGGLRWTMDAGEGKNPVVAGVSFSQEEQRDLLSTPAEVSNLSCRWSQRPGQDTALGCCCSCLAVGIQDRETKPWSPATPRLPGLISLHPWCWVVEHIIHKPENWYDRVTISPEQRMCSVTGPCLGLKGTLQSSKVAITGRAKQRRWLGSLSQPHFHVSQLY